METPVNVNENQNFGVYNPHSTGGNTFWNKTEFDGAINDRGYNCTTENAVKCACISKASGSPLPSCQNCGGTGWVYVNKKEKVRIVMQGMAFTGKYFNWTEANMATSRATTWDIDKLVFMDKITLEDTTTIYSQNIEMIRHENKVFAFTVYKIEKILDLFAFVSVDKPLKKLIENVDYTYEKGKNILYLQENLLNLPNQYISIRYEHKPAYVVIDILRDVIQNVVTEVGEVAPKLKNLPLSYICRRMHFALNTSFLGKNNILDNG